MGWSRVAVVSTLLAASCHAGLLGAGFGEGSCAAAPFRSVAVKWPAGCPAGASCCSEYGYCRPKTEWDAGYFRDCNGVSNGQPLAEEALQAETAAAANGDTAAAQIVASVGYAAAVPLSVIPATVQAYFSAVPVTSPIAGPLAAAPVAPAGLPYAVAPGAGAIYAAAPAYSQAAGYAAASPATGYASVPAAAYAAAPAAAYGLPASNGYVVPGSYY